MNAEYKQSTCILYAIKKYCWFPNDHSCLYIDKMSWFAMPIINVHTAQNMIALELNFSLVIQCP